MIDSNLPVGWERMGKQIDEPEEDKEWLSQSHCPKCGEVVKGDTDGLCGGCV